MAGILSLAVCLQVEPVRVGNVDFNRDVRPILANHCFACHGPDEQSRKSDLRLDRRGDATKETESGVRPVVPGKPDESDVVRRIFATDDSELMPPPSANKPLTDHEKRILRNWVEQGAEYQPHWAFVPPVQAALPSNRRSLWPDNPIDSFILARMEAENVTPAADADRHRLARRVSLDLVGIPSSPDEADVFAADPAPDAYDRFIDRLLASPAYGERWARKWLDLARYADTNGYEKDRVRSIWPYRDWVIDAINSDMAFDEFTIKQLAGDMLPGATLADRVATGFHRNTMINEEGGIDPLEFRFHAMVDRVNTTGIVWLGLTIGCAQCHAHKFDPISQSDYYRTMAFLNNADEPMIPVPNSDVEKRRSEISSQIAELEANLPRRFPPEGKLEWRVVRPVAATSTSEARLQILDDGSILASGKIADKDDYTIGFDSIPIDVAAIQLEALTDSTLPKTGPGRAVNGNFVVTDFTVSRINQAGDGKEIAVVLASARADYDQSGFPAVSAIDQDKEKSGWAVAGSLDGNTERAATFSLLDPQEPTSAGRWRIQIRQGYGGRHVLGRFRIRFGRFVDDGRSLEQRRRDHMEHRFSAWLAEASSKATPWTALKPTKAMSNLPLLTILDDNSVLASGDQSKSDRYCVQYSVDQSAIAAIRLEAIPDDRLPNGGPGRVYYEGPYGDFQLSDFHVLADGKPVPIAAASQSFADGKNTASLAIDDNLQTGWSINGGQGKPHVAVFHFAQPVDPKGSLELSMLFEKYYSAGLGRFRISVTTEPLDPKASLLPADIEDLLVIEPPLRTRAQVDRLRAYFLSIAPELESAREEIRNLKNQLPANPTTLVLAERPPGASRPTYRHHRGEFLQPKEAVEAEVPSMFAPLPASVAKNRLTFAQWLVNGDNPLTSRVAMNRQWAAFFGRGIVRTTEDLGYQGEPPSHPELLDWLAVELVGQKWSMKRMHRLLVTSSTYRQSSNSTPAVLAKDAENRLWARAPRVRLDAETIRDELLTFAGMLTFKIGGPSVFPPQPPGITSEGTYGPLEWKVSEGADRYRRGLYTFSKRTAPYAMFATFDAPSGEACVARREVTNTPLQALAALNDTVFFETSQELGAWAAALDMPAADRTIRLFRRCLVRPPTQQETFLLADFHRIQKERLANGDLQADKIASPGPGDLVDRAAWTLVARAILNLDEVIVRD